MQTTREQLNHTVNRVYNFSPGPATLPDEVLLQAQQELLNWNDTGVSVMEMSHRDPRFIDIANAVTSDLATLINLPETHTILYLHGGARTQFATVPLNLGNHFTHAHYANTGLWSNLACKQAEKYIKVEELVTINPNTKPTQLQTHEPKHPNAAYFHYTPNETVSGVYMQQPETNLPLVADGTSCLLALNMDIAAHDIIYASAQKNMGTAGITFVIIKKSLIEDREPLPFTPNMLRYHNHLEKNSMYNTPSTYSLYISGLMFQWQLKHGGVQAFAKRHINRSKKVYELIDHHPCYINTIHPDYRSPINIIFHLKTDELNLAFLEFAKSRKLDALKGHRSVGGLRASLYTGMPDAGVDKLLECMEDFSKKLNQS